MKYIIFFLFSVGTTLNITAQNIDFLMDGFNNSYALKHISLFTKPENQVEYGSHKVIAPPISHRSLKIINVDSDWLQSITNLVKQDPTLLYPYLDTENQNLAAYILLLHTLEIDMPRASNYDETISINFIKKYILDSEAIKEFNGIENKPENISDEDYFVNTVWGDVVITGVNDRIKTVINQRKAN